MNEGWSGVAGVVGSTPAPGWYADPWGQAPQRFWNGASWTPHIAAVGASSRPRLAEGAPIYGRSIWLMAVLPVISAATLWLFRFNTSAMTDYLQSAQDAARSGDTTYVAAPNPFTMLGPGYVVAMLVSLLVYAALVVLAYRDSRWLSRAGVVRPFHWAWAFLNGLVYVIGRSVIVRKVAAPRGLAPMWTAIAVYVLVQVSAAMWVVAYVASMTQQLAAGVG